MQALALMRVEVGLSEKLVSLAKGAINNEIKLFRLIEFKYIFDIQI